MFSIKNLAVAGFCLSLLAAASPGHAQDLTGSVVPVADLGLVVACADLVPDLTAADAPSVTTSGIFSSQYDAWRAFDASSSTMWISQVFETPAWIAYDFGQPRVVTRYSIKNTNGPVLVSRAPKDFEFQGFDGSDWVTLDARLGETDWVSGQPRTYDVANPGLYSNYRLYITDDNDVREGVVVISIGDLRFESCLVAFAGE
ncbi:MAG: discoidin domain-containing protein [Acidobacteriota bacterium]